MITCGLNLWKQTYKISITKQIKTNFVKDNKNISGINLTREFACGQLKRTKVHIKIKICFLK